ncbi:alpha/beta fold hydrolase [Hoeflea sp. WL0058]|uniref:Alpha/beta fold hydrolase n=1 Tax=Flavimaribacter sediminis TaxID=2865987 RepID=A0AAE2ZIR6_9HYPH|nr:alpha/beta fold hydrolase [Flavimaribacter sediminis]MBW8636956.1 alpha/beta fold hydrolase [Flavimaribacter sediminis]
MIWKIGISLALFPVIYLLIAFVLILFPPRVKDTESLNFSQLHGGPDLSEQQKMQKYTARDGQQLAYRHYPSRSSVSLILLHGSGYHGGYLDPMARYLSNSNAAQIYVPNLRGHFGSGECRGDIGYIGQLEDDLSDLVDIILASDPDTTIIMGGHSSGGAMAIRFAASEYGEKIENYIALAPILGHKAPTVIEGNGGWAHISLPRIIGLSMLNNVRVHIFDHLETIRFNMPEQFQNGTETLGYSWRLMTNFNLHTNFRSDIEALPQTSLTLVGRDDEAMNAGAFIPLFNALYRSVELLDDQDHFSLTRSETSLVRINLWLDAVTRGN